MWKDKGMFDIREQNLCDQARMIRKNEWLSAVELEMIKRYVLEDPIEQSLNEVEAQPVSDNELELVDNLNIDENSESGIEEIVVLENNRRSDEQREIIREIIDIMKDEEKEFIPGFKRVERRKLAGVCEKVNEIVNDIQTETITETNNLLKSISIYCARKVGLKKPQKRNKKTKVPWWKRRLKDSIDEIRKHLNILERKQRGEKISKRKCTEVERKYKVLQKGLNCVIEELKQRLNAKSFKLKRYEQRIDQFRVNKLFQQDQKKVYQELNGKEQARDAVPDSEESKQFWANIWSKQEAHKDDAEWLEELRQEKRNVRQENFVITEAMVKQQCKKLPNWKAPGPDDVQGYWFKKISSLHNRK